MEMFEEIFGAVVLLSTTLIWVGNQTRTMALALPFTKLIRSPVKLFMHAYFLVTVITIS